MTVHFICRGNAHRSVIAEAYLKSLQLHGVTVCSSGTVADMYRAENEPRIPIIAARLHKYGISDFMKMRPDQLTQARADGADQTIFMNQIVANEASGLIIVPKNAIVWDVTDSGEGNRIIHAGEDEYKYLEEVYKEITHNVDELVKSDGLGGSRE